MAWNVPVGEKRLSGHDLAWIEALSLSLGCPQDSSGVGQLNFR